MLWLAGGGRRTAQAGGRAVAQNPRKKRKKKSRKAQWDLGSDGSEVEIIIRIERSDRLTPYF